MRLVTVAGGRRYESVGVGVYLARGNVLSGVYAFAKHSPPVGKAVRLAKLSAKNLARAG